MKSKKYIKRDYEKYIQKLTKKNMQQLFIDNFGGWSDEVSKQKFFDVLEKGEVYLFFEEEFIGYVSWSFEEDYCLINDIHVVEKGKGYGAKILQFVESKIDCRLKVLVFEENPALQFYLKNGFEKKEYIEKSKTWILFK